MKRIAFLVLGIALALASPAVAKKASKAVVPTLPSYFTISSKFKVATEGGGSVAYEDFGESTFYMPGNEDGFVKQGKHWTAPLELVNPPKDIDALGVWALLKPQLVAGGWTVPVESDNNPGSASLRYQKGGKDAYAYIKFFGFDDIRLEIVEVASQTVMLVINPPAAKPEVVSLKTGDFPYLPPLAGSKLGSSGPDGPLSMRVSDTDEDELVGTGSITKYYRNLPGVSTLQFVTIYKDALTKAGWTILYSNAQSDAVIDLHYAKNSRDIWAYLHMGAEEYNIRVADAGAQNDIAKQMAKDCHVALYGVLFDFNKATLKPESDGVLQRVLAFLQTDKTMKLEVQGHTDNVGGDDYNQKLSEARAKSVLGWLTAHGIAADRLSFKGYGKTKPVATNDTDEGRAKNRRVEIAKPGCTK